MAAFAISLGALGLVIGSFVNVVARRVPEGEAPTGRSHCPRCGHVLGPLELVPVVSWLALRGRCRHCRAPVSWTYPAGELTCGLLFAALAMRFDSTAPLPAYLLAAAGLVALSVADLRTMRLPDRILLPLTLSVVAAFVGVAAVEGEWSAIGRAIAAGATALLGLGLLHVAVPRALGFGDVKLAFVLGVVTGWISWSTLALGLLLASVLGGVAGIGIALVAGGPIRGRQIPFGPFLAAGALLAILVGEPILRWYSRLGT